MSTITGSVLINEVEALAKQAGDKYVYGGTTTSGFDCSGLIYDALSQLGVQNPPRTSEEQWSWTQHINANQIQPGDLVFAQFPGDNAPPGHVGIYIGNGQVFSARDPQAGIGIDSLSSWGSAIYGYGRIPNVQTSGATGTGTATTDASIGGLFSWPGDIVGFFKDAKTLVDALLWIVNPASWLRIGAFMLGMLLILFAIYALMKVGSDEPLFKMPQVVPVPV